MDTNRKVPALRFKEFKTVWEEKKLGDFAKFRRGSFPQPYGRKEWYNGEGAMPFVQVVDVNQNLSLVNNTKQKISKLAQPRSVLVEKGKVVVTLQGSIGRVAVLQYDAYVDRTLLIFERYEDQTDVTFWAYLIQNKFDVEKKIAPGGTIKTITKEALSSFSLSLPNFKEQTHIGIFFKDLDRLICLQKRKYETLTQLKEAMLVKMFPKEGANFPEIRFKGFTDKWEEKNLGEVFVISSASRVHKNEWVESGVPFFRSSDVVSAFKGSSNTKAYISPDLYKQLSSMSGKVQKGDLLITGGGSIGIPYLINSNDPLYFKDADLLWLRNINNLNSFFFFTFFVTPVFRKYINSVTHIGTISHYTIEQAKMTPIKLPNLKEQQKIGAYFQNLDQLISQSQLQIEKYKNIKQALLAKMFI